MYTGLVDKCIASALLAHYIHHHLRHQASLLPLWLCEEYRVYRNKLLQYGGTAEGGVSPNMEIQIPLEYSGTSL